MKQKPVILCILDGWGLSDTKRANAPLLAHTPHFDRLMQNYPNARLITHGTDVGLPEGQMGNSEVGHLTIGAGRIVKMQLGRIDEAIADGSFANMPSLRNFIARLQKSGGAAHLMGIASDGGVHSHMTHIIAAANIISNAKIPVHLHLATDGRDVSEVSAMGFLRHIIDNTAPGVHISTLIGRYFAYDRDRRWPRISQAYQLMLKAEGTRFADPIAGLESAYASGVTDEFIPPLAREDYGGMKDGDGLFCLNFRPDRARQIIAALAAPEFTGFERPEMPRFSACLGMVSYSEDHDRYIEPLFLTQKIKNTLGECVEHAGKSQFRLAETEKYPHVTFFLNGGRETPFQRESRYMPASPKVKTYDEAPEMAAEAVGTHLVKAIDDRHDLIVVNFANPDMVGHTGDLKATILACEAVDRALGSAMQAAEKAGATMLITADHGNCEKMENPKTGESHTAHTTNPVPVILVGAGTGSGLRDGRLSDISPTLLQLMGIAPPPEMTGKSLIIT